MNSEVRVGLLPFYLKLYDDVQPEARAGYDAFLNRIVSGFEARSVGVSRGPICRTAGEFGPAVAAFEREGVDAIVTLHLAYSPSLEAIDACCRTRLPLLLLDATMDAAFGMDVAPERIGYNHGIHGVMDFACMLRRRGRRFEIVAGHDGDPQTLDRAAAMVRAFAAARAFRGSRVLRIGPAFAGMGDFAVEPALLRERFGIEVGTASIDALDAEVGAIQDADVAAEVAADRERFDCDLDDETHRRSARVGLGLRHLMEEDGCAGMSINFQAFDRADRAADTMPFLEISKAMARGTGYAGEGDVLTAALVGALARAFNAVTFTEIFCPDWAGGTLFLSHMGEISPAVAADRPRVFKKPFPFGGGRDPAVLTCAVQPGPAAYVNLAPGPGDSFSLIVAPVDVLAETTAMDPRLRDTVRAWIRPPLPVPAFLEAYARAGGTHHSALVLGAHAEALGAFGRCSGLDTVLINRSDRSPG